jgi:hypothetical protein
VQQVHKLIVALADPPFLLSPFFQLYFAPAQIGNPAKFQQQQKANANLLEQEPDAMSDVTIVASVVAFQAVF